MMKGPLLIDYLSTSLSKYYLPIYYSSFVACCRQPKPPCPMRLWVRRQRPHIPQKGPNPTFHDPPSGDTAQRIVPCTVRIADAIPLDRRAVVRLDHARDQPFLLVQRNEPLCLCRACCAAVVVVMLLLVVVENRPQRVNLGDARVRVWRRGGAVVAGAAEAPVLVEVDLASCVGLDGAEQTFVSSPVCALY